MAPFAWALALALLAAGPALAGSLEGGSWKVVRAERGGEPNAAELNAVLTFADGKLTLVSPEGETVEFDYTVDAGQDPAQIDLARGEGDKRFTLQGIWMVTDGEFSLCLSTPFSDRPTEFATRPGKATSLTIHERAEK
ncbi:MAG: TIGR03067 domain-containing protein [Myxococcales bacterium]|nr:TIGR03067 domain-containing protein [Myxococcales bacterium]